MVSTPRSIDLISPTMVLPFFKMSESCCACAEIEKNKIEIAVSVLMKAPGLDRAGLIFSIGMFFQCKMIKTSA
jgi:hypothetical protein